MRTLMKALPCSGIGLPEGPLNGGVREPTAKAALPGPPPPPWEGNVTRPMHSSAPAAPPVGVLASASGGPHPMTLLAGGGGAPARGRFGGEGAGGPKEGGIAEGEDPAVRRPQPIALAGRRGRHAHDRLVELDGAGRAEEGGIAERED